MFRVEIRYPLLRENQCVLVESLPRRCIHLPEPSTALRTISHLPKIFVRLSTFAGAASRLRDRHDRWGVLETFASPSGTRVVRAHAAAVSLTAVSFKQEPSS